MMRKTLCVWALAFGAVALCASGVVAKKHVMYVSASEFTTKTPVDTTLGKYYVIELEIPSAVSQSPDIIDAYIDLHVDASNSIDSDLLAGLATIEVYPLVASLTGELDPDDLGRVVTKTSVPVGLNRFVRLHIMPFIDMIRADSNSNHGLVIGSLSGSRVGHFTVRQGEVATGHARVTFVYR